MTKLQSSDKIRIVRDILTSAKNIVILSGAGMSAESHVAAIKETGGYWRQYDFSSLATPEAFNARPGLGWEFYQYRREVAAKAQPNPALGNRGSPNANFAGGDVSVMTLPHCKKPECGGLLRLHIVWFGECLEQAVLEKADRVMSVCEACLVVGTSSVVYPASMYAPSAAARGTVVVEFNIDSTPASSEFQYCFEGSCEQTLPSILFKL